MPSNDQPAASKQHYYRIKVCGYVFPQLPPGMSPEEIRAAVEKAVENGDLDVTQTTVEAEFDD
jgi:hypothetical protein